MNKQLLFATLLLVIAIYCNAIEVSINQNGQQYATTTTQHVTLHPQLLTVQEQKQHTSTLVDLLQGKLGGTCLSTSDEFFAECSNLVKPGRGITNDLYTENGKWMDGWESRRKRTPGHDWAILKLGLPGMIRVVDIDTNNFIGNYPYHASLDAAELSGDVTDFTNVQWTQIVPKVPLNASSQHIYKLDEHVTLRRYTHLRLHIYPDGGVARLRVYGDVSIDWAKYKSDDVIDLAAVENGGVAIYTSDEHFGVKSNINSPGRGVNMGDGWETRRRRGPGNDWLIVRLGATCKHLQKIEIDTAHFKGNFPDRASIEGIYLEESIGANVALGWTELLSQKKLKAHTQHFFDNESDFVNSKNVNVNHIRLNIFPDGGVSRLRVWCTKL